MATVTPLVRDYFAAWNEADVDAIASLFHDDACFTDPSVSEPVVGREAIRAHVAKVFRYWPEEEWVAMRHWEHEHGFTVLWRATIVSPRSGRDVTFDGVDVFCLDGSKIRELLIYFDPTAWRRLLPRNLVPQS